MSDETNQNSAVNDRKIIDDARQIPKTKEEVDRTKVASQYTENRPSRGLNMHVKVHSPFKNYFDDLAISITAVNDTGPFDILPKHHNFISLLNACDIIIRDVNQETEKIGISGGIMHVKADEVIVFLDV